MKIAMTSKEQELLVALLTPARRYLEYGSGGSTVLAADMCDQVTSIDSSIEWLQKVREAVPEGQTELTLIDIDLGPLREWGFPNQHNPEQFRRYSRAGDASCLDADLVLVDGRFRVSCFAAVCLSGYSGPIAVHDYRDRPWYFGIEAFAQEIARADTLSVFLPRNRELAQEAWSFYCEDPR